MKTKYGEINRISDYFDWVKTYWEDSESGRKELRRCYEVFKCKVCGDEITGLSINGAYRSGDKGIIDMRKEHLELHYKIKDSITLTEIEI